MDDRILAACHVLADRVLAGVQTARPQGYVAVGEATFLFKMFALTGAPQFFQGFGHLLEDALQTSAEGRPFYLLGHLAALRHALSADEMFRTTAIWTALDAQARAALEAAQGVPGRELDLLRGMLGLTHLRSLTAADKDMQTPLKTVLRHVARQTSEVHAPLCRLVPPSAPDPEAPNALREIDLGLAHGNAGILAVLAATSGRAPCTLAQSQGVLRGFVARFVDLADRAADSRFGYAIERPGTSRVAWCYGDLSVLLAMSHAAPFLEPGGWTSLRQDILDAVVPRLGRNDGLTEGGLCHGTAGLMVMAMFLESRGLDAGALRRHGAARLLDDIEHRRAWLDDASTDLLEGLSGMGLALIAHGTNTRARWAELMLL